jgi:hypothetical protein
MSQRGVLALGRVLELEGRLAAAPPLFHRGLDWWTWPERAADPVRPLMALDCALRAGEPALLARMFERTLERYPAVPVLRDFIDRASGANRRPRPASASVAAVASARATTAASPSP